MPDRTKIYRTPEQHERAKRSRIARFKAAVTRTITVTISRFVEAHPGVEFVLIISRDIYLKYEQIDREDWLIYNAESLVEGHEPIVLDDFNGTVQVRAR